MKSNVKKSDTELKKDVLAELKYEPTVNVAGIGVLVKDGVVTLNGYASTYGEKWDAVHAAQRVAGVKAIADDIEVKLPDSHRRTDSEIAAAAANAIELNNMVPKGAVEVMVRDGRITLDGQVEWWHQANAAQMAVRHLAGVKEVINRITIKPNLVPSDVSTVIKSAFERNALLEARKIQVEIAGNKAVLRGNVRSYAERQEAERAALAAPGVSEVENQLKVEYSL